MLVFLLILFTIGIGEREATLSIISNALKEVVTVPYEFFLSGCVEDVGCLDFSPPFFHFISQKPSEDLGTEFLLFTPRNSQNGEKINSTSESIKRSSWDRNLPLKVIIHGFTSVLAVGDSRYQMKDALLKENDFNVILVNWTKSDGFPYAQAFTNAMAVGVQVADLLQVIMNTTGLQAKDIHLIGHSMGAQMCGVIGERIPNLSRISGLDPAGPLYRDEDPSESLDYTDAKFVDIIHTDGNEVYLSGYGISRPIGHIDFYPNGGRRQPGCEDESNSSSLFVSQTQSNFCNHDRALDYFTESIEDSKCRFLAVKCDNFVDFKKGRCPPRQNSTISEMGYHAEPIQGLPPETKFFLSTSDSSPYCIQSSVYPRDNE